MRLKLKQTQEKDCLHLKRMDVQFDKLPLKQCQDCGHIFLREFVVAVARINASVGIEALRDRLLEELKTELLDKDLVSYQKKNYWLQRLLKKVMRLDIPLSIPNFIMPNEKAAEEILRETIDNFLEASDSVNKEKGYELNLSGKTTVLEAKTL